VAVLVKYDKEEVRRAAIGRWPEILRVVGGFSEEELSGKHCPCPLCGGEDRFRFIDKEAGAVFCNHCFKTKNGDGFAAIKWRLGVDFRVALETVAGYLGIEEEQKREEVAAYNYVDEHGKQLYQTIRYKPKKFSYRHFDAEGKRREHIRGVRRILYRTNKLAKLPPGSTVYVVEGEKDVEALEAVGLVATSNPMGAGNWLPCYSEQLAGHNVFIIEDNDEAGRAHAIKVARSLAGLAMSTKIVRLPGLERGGDASDYLAKHTAGDFLAVCEADGVPLPADEKPQAASPAKHEQTNWPAPLGEIAFHGLAGRIVRDILPQTEADEAALLLQFLACFGNVIGRTAHFRAEADKHYCNLFIALVADSSKGRKGSSLGQIRSLFERICETWEKNIAGGLSTGEGLIHAVRDADPNKQRRRGEPEDHGVADKRLMCIESEFGGTLRVMSRQANSLSAVVRQAWDSGNLRSMTKHSATKATGAHISIIAHVTKDELIDLLTSTDTSNGFANRFLWVCARRSKLLPEGGKEGAINYAMHEVDLGAAIEFARQASQVDRDLHARTLWSDSYATLSSGRPGLLGSATSRAEAQVGRLAVIYAMLDLSDEVQHVHLMAALEVWRYCLDSAACIFGVSTGDPLADDIRELLTQAGKEGMKRKEIWELTGKYRSAVEMSRAFAVLKTSQIAHYEAEDTGGRPGERWFIGP
jgi:hypothetical protein